jgi:hypothetical protein
MIAGRGNGTTIMACFVICLMGAHGVWGKDPRGRPVRVFGSVKDSSGVPLSGVSCKLWVGSADRLVKDTKSEILQLNGSYDILRSEVLDIGLHFAKEGYYSTGFVYDLANVDSATSSVGGVQTIQRDVVLEPKLTGLPELDGYAQGIGLVAGSKLVIMDLRGLAARRNRRTVVVTTTVQTLEYPYTSCCLRLGYPFLAADLLPQTGVQRVSQDQSKWGIPPDPVSPKDAIAQLRLCEAGTTEGLILAPASWLSDESDTRKVAFPHEMQEAPAEGYQSSVSIPAEAFLDSVGKRVFFFLKCGNCYGKGWLTGMRYREQEGSWCCDIELVVNPSGSRNLGTHPKEAD